MEGALAIRRGRLRPSTNLGRAVTGYAVLMPIAYSPALRNGFFVPRYALTALAAALTLPVLVAGARRDWASRLAVAFLGWAAMAAALNPEPVLSLLGRWNLGVGWMFYAAAAGLWAVGRALAAADVAAVRTALLVGAVANAGVMVLAALLDLSPYGITQSGGRSVGLLGNPVHVGALLVCSLVLVGSWSDLRGAARALLLAGLMGVGLGLSGSRAALLGVPVVAVGLARTIGWRRGTAVVAVAAAAVMASSGLDARGQDVASRISSSGASASERPGAWATALDAISERPLLGRGPGRFREATAPHRTEESLDESSDTYFDDAHNVVLEMMVGLGVPGALLGLAFIGLATREAAGPFAWSAAAAVPYLLLQPLTVAFTPLLLLALGASGAGARAVERHRVPPPLLLAAGATTAAAAVLSVAVVAGSYFLKRTYQDFELVDARRAERLLRPWPEGAIGRAQPAALRSSRAAPREVDEGISWYAEAARRNPGDPALWAALADYELSFGRVEAARGHYRELLRRDPVSLRARWGLAIAAADRGDLGEAFRLLDEAEALRPEEDGTERLRNRLLRRDT